MHAERIVQMIHEVARLADAEIVSPLRGDTVLLESGLDSIGFAMLVARLEEEFGYDPFTMMDQPVYPRTLDEFVSIYERHQPSQ